MIALFDFKGLFAKAVKQGEKGERGRRSVGVQLLGALLVCYPEVASLSYEPREDRLSLFFLVKSPLPTRGELLHFVDLLEESLEAYHELEFGMNAWLAIRTEGQGTMLTFEVVRNIADLSRGELEIMAELFDNEYGERLEVAEDTAGEGTELFDMQSDMLDYMLDNAAEIAATTRERLAGLRENGRIAVFNK